MNKIIGFIGSGNMGNAMIGGIVGSKLVTPENIIVADLNEKQLAGAKEAYGVNTTTDNLEVAKKCDIIILSIKPHIYPIVIEGIKNDIKEEAIIVVIAAGKDIEDTQSAFGRKVKVVKVMPNTPAMVGEGMAAINPSKEVTKEELEEIISIFESFGKAEVVNKDLMDAVTAISGSSPAYVYMFIEALADGAVLEGMPRDMAYKFAAQAVLGSAKMVLETGIHPGKLKDNVCSPGGTTIAAVSTLEEKGFRHAVMAAVKRCADKSREMSN